MYIYVNVSVCMCAYAYVDLSNTFQVGVLYCGYMKQHNMRNKRHSLCLFLEHHRKCTLVVGHGDSES